VAEYFSNKSRKRGQSYFSNQEEIKKIFRKSANKFWETNSSEILVCGHSHCLDDFRPIPNRQYLNNGFPTNSGYFLIIDEGIPSFCKFNFNV
jgi:UDP-2,3-diacylglucosamine pyrophosphatase LpxH